MIKIYRFCEHRMKTLGTSIHVDKLTKFLFLIHFKYSYCCKRNILVLYSQRNSDEKYEIEVNESFCS